MTALPCPGDRACRAPRASAIKRERATSDGDRWGGAINAAKRSESGEGTDNLEPRGEGRAAATGEGMKVKRASVTSSGLVSMSCGYRRSASLTLLLGAVEVSNLAPPICWTTISFQPSRSG